MIKAPKRCAALGNPCSEARQWSQPSTRAASGVNRPVDEMMMKRVSALARNLQHVREEKVFLQHLVLRRL